MEKKALSVRARQWRQIVSEGNSSPLTKTAWCRENGIRFRAFMYWQKKFRDEELDNLPNLQQRTEIQCREELPAFVDVTGVMPLEHPEDSRFVESFVLL